MKGKSNPVAKFMNVYNRASTHSTPKDYDRKENGTNNRFHKRY